MKPYPLILGLAVAFLTGTTAQSAETDRSQYHLLNPTPRDQMRPFSTDATTSTLTPYTVDAGHFQVEANIFDYFYDKEDATTSEGWIFGYSTLKVGLCDQSDLEVTFSSLYQDYTVKNRDTGGKERFTGFGDVQLASKINLWGNNGGTTALAIYPLVNFPTGDDSGGYYGGFRMIFSAQLPYQFRLGLKSGPNLYKDAGSLHATFRNSISLEREIVHRLNGYLEFATSIDEQDSSWWGFFNVGLAHQVTRDLQLHAGIYIDVNNANNYNPYLGFSWRY